MNSKDIVGLAICGVFAWPQSCGAAADAPQFQLGDLQKIIRLSNARISPDGRQIAVMVSTPDWKTDKDQVEIDIVDTASGARRALTWKRTGISSPKWSEDGSRLAFLAEDSTPKDDPPLASDSNTPSDAANNIGEKHAQVFVMPMNGGDPLRVTNAIKGVDEFAWSPDGKQIAFTAADEPEKAKAIREHDDAFQVTDNHFLTRTALTPSHLWVVASAGGTARRLTQGAISLQTDQRNTAPAPAWSPSGRSIAFTRFPGPYWGPSFHSTIAAVDAVGGDVRTLVPDEGSVEPKFAPAGEMLAFMRPRDGDQNNGMAVYVWVNGAASDLTKDLPRHFDSYDWLPGGKALLLSGIHGTHGTLWRQPLHATANMLDLGEVEASPDLSVAKTGAVAFIGRTATHPNELYLLDSVDAKPRRLTDFNAFADNLALARTESIEWQGPNGFPEDGVLTYPVGYQKGSHYPLVVLIHGGPASASTVKFAPLPQLLAAAGFLVFQPNYRGSTNRGDAYQHAIYRDTGEGPGNDIMAGLAAVIKKGVVDQDHIGVSGWSYGGYMTAWLTSHYPHWKAAVAGAPLTDWAMDYTVAFYQQGDNYFFGGSPWTAKYRDIWREQSPINYAQNVTAPTLIMGDVGDPNVPLLNGYEWFHALRDAGVEVEFYAYPVDTHFPKDIVRTTDVYRRWVAWMTKRLK